MFDSLMPWRLLFCLPLAYLLWKSLPSASAQTNSRSLVSTMVGLAASQLLPSAVLSIRSTHALPSRPRLDAHGHQVGSYTAHGPEGEPEPAPTSSDSPDPEKIEKDLHVGHTHNHVDDTKGKSFQTDADAMAQLIGVAILEFGVILHRHVSSIVHHYYFAQLTEPAPSVLIGLTLAVDESFKVLFVVIIFHRMYHLSSRTIVQT